MTKIFIAFVLSAAPALLFANPMPNEPTGTLITVGSDAACDYSNLTAATFANGSIPNIYVRVAKNAVPNLHTLPGRNMSIEGGYDTCSDTTPSGRTVIAGTGNLGSVLWLTASYTGSTSYTVNLTNLDIQDGIGQTGRGGGVTINGPFKVFMSNTVVRNNSSGTGGGIYIKGQAGDAGGNELTQIVLSGNSEVKFNSADRGGGIACEEKANVRIYDAAVNNNEVTEVGGGLYSVGCHTTVYEARPGFAQGLFFNEANGSFTGGGGIYADSGSVFLRGGLNGPARVVGNSADLGGGIYLRNNAKLYAYDSEISTNTAIIGGGVYAENSTTVIARTREGAGCHDPMRCSKLSENWATAPGATTGGGGGAVFADGGTTRISGTFMEKNRAFGGRGMAVRVINAPGSNAGFDQNGLRILGSVVAENTDDGGAVDGYESIIEFKNSSGVVGFTTFARNGPVPNIVYTPATGTFYEIDVYGSIFDASTGNAAGPGSSGPVPNGDCNRLHENTSAFAMNSLRSNAFIPEFIDANSGDYRLGGLNQVDWCDASYNVLSSVLSADGGPRPYDDPGISAQFGNYDLGGLERHPSDLIFRDGFEAF